MSTAKLPSNRSFGFTFVIFFTILGAYSWWSGGQAYLYLFGFALATASVTLLRAELLAPLNKVWMKFGEILHQIVNPIVLGIIFFGVITPFGLAMRLMGRDPLRRKMEQDAVSYWITRNPPGPESDSLTNQF